MAWYIAFAVVALTACLGVVISQDSRLPAFIRPGRKIPEMTLQQLRQRQLSYEAVVKQARRYGAPEPVPDFVLVDVRTPEETIISVILNALTIDQFEANAEDFKYRTVICYCTVGFRSEHYARLLRDRGFNAWNFKGSIMEWCAAKYPLQTLAHQPTNRVHTYSDDYQVPPEYQAVW